MTTDEILLGVGLIVALAVGSQVLASRLKIPALILLLPTRPARTRPLLVGGDDWVIDLGQALRSQAWTP